MNWVIGLSSIALVLLVTLIVFGNLSGNLGITTTTTTTYTNESCFINETGYTPVGVTSQQGFMSYTITEIGINQSVENGYILLTTSNYTQTGNILYNASEVLSGFEDAGCSYIATYRSGEYNQAENVITNYSSGVGKLTTQIPTIFLFVGIGLLLVVLIVVLAWVIKKFSNLGGVKGNLE